MPVRSSSSTRLPGIAVLFLPQDFNLVIDNLGAIDSLSMSHSVTLSFLPLPGTDAQ